MACAFTLIELMVVVSVLALLASMLMPALLRAQQITRAATCYSNLKGIGDGLVIYQTANNGYVVPSYNMTGTTSPTNPAQAMDGWATILDRDQVVAAVNTNTNNIYGCPEMLNIDGWIAGNSGATDQTACGYMEWPTYSLRGPEYRHHHSGPGIQQDHPRGILDQRQQSHRHHHHG